MFWLQTGPGCSAHRDYNLWGAGAGGTRVNLSRVRDVGNL